MITMIGYVGGATITKIRANRHDGDGGMMTMMNSHAVGRMTDTKNDEHSSDLAVFSGRDAFLEW